MRGRQKAGLMIVIHHNPGCSTSRKVLGLIRAAGHDPVVIPYLETGWTRPQLLALFAAAGITPRQALRTRNTAAAALGLTAPGASEARIVEAMLLRPDLVERPIVVTPRGVRLCRPVERLDEILG